MSQHSFNCQGAYAIIIEIFAPQKSEKNESVSVSNVRQLSPPPPPSTDNTTNTAAETAEQTKRDFETIHIQLEVGSY